MTDDTEGPLKTYTRCSRMAERLTDQAHRFTYGDANDPVTGAALAAEAQVYATLAVAAASLAGGIR